MNTHAAFQWMPSEPKKPSQHRAAAAVQTRYIETPDGIDESMATVAEAFAVSVDANIEFYDNDELLLCFKGEKCMPVFPDELPFFNTGPSNAKPQHQQMSQRSEEWTEVESLWDDSLLKSSTMIRVKNAFSLESPSPSTVDEQTIPSSCGNATIDNDSSRDQSSCWVNWEQLGEVFTNPEPPENDTHTARRIRNRLSMQRCRQRKQEKIRSRRPSIFLNFCGHDNEAELIYRFCLLSEDFVWGRIVDNICIIQQIHHQLDHGFVDDRFQILGWDVRRRLVGTETHYLFSKHFTYGLSAYNMLERTWWHTSRSEHIKKIDTDTLRFDLLQEANSNARVFGRDVQSSDDRSVFRSVFLRYKMETTMKRIDSINPSGPKFAASGYIQGIHSMNPEQSSHIIRFGVSDGKKLQWVDMMFGVHFLSVINATTQESAVEVR